MKIKTVTFVMMFFLIAPSFAKYDDEKFCAMYGYAFAHEATKFDATLLMQILVHRGIVGDPKCIRAQNAGQSYQVQLQKAFTADGFDPSKITPEMNVVIQDFAAFKKQISTFLLKNTGYLD